MGGGGDRFREGVEPVPGRGPEWAARVTGSAREWLELAFAAEPLEELGQAVVQAGRVVAQALGGA